MTNLPAPPLNPAASYDLTQPPRPDAATGAALERVEWSGILTVGRRQFNLVPAVPAITMVRLDQAQNSGELLQVVEALPLLVQHAEREALKQYLLDDPLDPEDIVQLDDIVKALTNGLEQIAARPSNR